MLKPKLGRPHIELGDFGNSDFDPNFWNFLAKNGDFDSKAFRGPKPIFKVQPNAAVGFELRVKDRYLTEYMN